MRGIARNRIFLLVFTTLLLVTVILLSSLPGSPLHFLTSPISAVLEPVQKTLLGATDQVNGFFESLREGMRLREENRTLREENAELRSQIDQLAEAGRQYEALKEAFALKEQYAGYTIVGARVLTREIGQWFDVFRIDIGTADGFSVTETRSYAVVDAQSRLIGRVLSTDLVSGKVLPLIHEGFSVSAKVNTPDGALMRVRGTLDLKDQGLCLADQIPSGASLKPGDILVTSGVGGLFPAGIPIGTVISVRTADTGSERQAMIEPFAGFDQLTTVFVMKGETP
ncbi:MAG: rod shape-determining protein MreC [Clostridiales bacterium]|nr:rod shape-determining protein MreC [Clostridiales bacterium]